MKLEQLKTGTRIYYGGDMANKEDFGTITTQINDKWGQFVDVQLDDGRKINKLPICGFSTEYKGHGGTRFVTLEAYNAYRRKIAKNYNWAYKDAI
jgi:hypothetical protein